MRKGPWVIGWDTMRVTLDLRRHEEDRRRNERLDYVMLTTEYGESVTNIPLSREEFFEFARDVSEIRHELLQEEGR